MCLNQNDIEATPHVIAYFDILGTKEMFEKHCREALNILHKAYALVLELSHEINLRSDFHHQGGDLKVQIFSDNFIVALEYDDVTFRQKALSMSLLAMYFQFELLFKYKLSLRGSLTAGDLYINNNFVCGKGLINAYKMESERANFPRIVLSSEVRDVLLNAPTYPTTPDYKKIIHEDSDGETFLNFLCGDYETTALASLIEHLNNTIAAHPDSRVAQKMYWLKNYINNHLVAEKNFKGKSALHKNWIRYFPNAVSGGYGNPFDDEVGVILPLSSPPPVTASYAVRVSGDSMHPTYSDGDIVFVSTNSILKNGDIGIFHYDGSTYIKERGERGLISHNKKYPLLPFLDGLRCECQGKVIGSAQNVAWDIFGK